jgi:hypothetical protein
MADYYRVCLDWRGIDLRDVCPKCSGAGVYAYANTATWHLSQGLTGQALTNDICDSCWGSGSKSKPWLNLRKYHHDTQQLITELSELKKKLKVK